MKMVMVSYSMTGNNEALAAGIAAGLEMERVRVTEPKVRTMGKTALDVLLNRTPMVSPAAETLDGYDLVLFVGPVWMGHVATPFRAYLRRIKGSPVQYAFISISGGADGPNPGLARDLTRRTRKAPAALIDMHIADLLPPHPRPTRQQTQDYRLEDQDVAELTDTVLENLRGAKLVEGIEHRRTPVLDATPGRGSFC